MLKAALRLFFGISTQLIAVIISYEFIFRYAIGHGGIGAIRSIEVVHPLIWSIIIFELLICFGLLVAGVKDRIKSLNKQ